METKKTQHEQTFFGEEIKMNRNTKLENTKVSM